MAMQSGGSALAAMRGWSVVLLLAMGHNAQADHHDFHTLDRLTPTTTMGLSVGLEIAHRSSELDRGVGGDLDAHYVHASGAGGYLVFPASRIAAAGASQSALGNAELGALYTHPVLSQLELIGHVGVAIDYEHQGIAPLQYVAAIPRYEDLVQRWGFTTWLRFGMSAMGRRERVFWRADLGLDLMLDDHEGMGAHIGPVVHGGVGAGTDFGRNNVTLELVWAVTNPASREIDASAGTLAVGWRFVAGRWSPGVAVILPVLFNVAPLQDIAVAFALSITAGFP